MEKIIYNNKQYEYTTPGRFFKKPQKYLFQNIDTIKGSKYLNIGCAFDIETTKIDEHHSTMYMWQFAIGEHLTIIGREWFEFLDLLDVLQRFFNLSDDRKLLVFIHNASYEWQFLRKHIQLKYDNKHKKLKVFAMEERKVVYFETIQNIEFRDSLILTQRPLSKLSSGYNLPLKKLTGEIDYNQKYFSNTKLDSAHIAYGINDTQVLVQFFEKYAKREFLSKQLKLPLTSTGIVRDELKRNFKALSKETRMKWKNELSKCYPNEQEYKIIFQFLFRGGYVHGNGARTDEELINLLIGSQDFKSSYPAVLLHYKMPYYFCKKPKEFFDKIKYDRKYINEHAFYGTFVFTNIRAKYQHSIESVSKLIQYDSDSLVQDNGRLLKCDKIKVILSEYDWLLYQDFYLFDSVECVSQLRVSYKKELPTWFKDMILKYFYLKETLEKDSLEYKLAKSKLNSLYGMCVTSLLNTTFDYVDDEMQLVPTEQTFEKLKRKEILLPYWGIWTTAIARYNLLHFGFYQFCKTNSFNQALYGDTDSIKYTNMIGNQYIFDNFNKRIERMNKTMYVGDYERSIFKNLGKFDFENKYYKMKFLGAKRYIYSCAEFNKESQKYELSDNVTIAGCRKGSLQKYCNEKNLDIYKTFSNGMILDKEHSDKKTSFYNDEPFQMKVVDEFGQEQYVEELSSITLNDIPFSMNMSEDFLKTIALLKQKNKRRIGDRIW